MSYREKYLKYKQKYLELKNILKISQLGGSKKSNTFVNIDDISALTDEPNEINAYGYELQSSNVNLNEVITTTTVEDMVGGGIESPFISENQVNSNSSIETSSIRRLDEISSLKDSSEKSESIGLSDITTEQYGGNSPLPPLSGTDSTSSERSELDSDTSDSD